MTNDFDLSIREIDDLLQHLYSKLKGKKEGLSLTEPAGILLAQLKSANPPFYAPQLVRFTPIIMDTLISGAYISFGYEGLLSLNEVAGDIALATGEYIPDGVEEGLSRIRKEIESISAILSGESPDCGPMADIGGKSETGTGGFFRESAWGTVGLPLVSIYSTGKTPFSTGRVVKARVEIRITGEWSIRKKHDPAITFDHISAEPNSIFESQIHTAIKVAEDYAAAVMGMKGIFRVPREYRISLPEIASFPASAIQRLSGGSAGLAITALLISVLSSFDLYKQRLKFDNCTSFTGKVDPDGNILAVEDSHITDKVKAVFFSRFSKLILPTGNLDTAENELAALSREYPARKLDLVPAPDVTGLVRDSNVTERSMTPAGKPLLQRLFMWRKHLAASLVPLLLAVLILFILPPYLDRNVDTVTIEDDRLVMKNLYGHQVSTYEAGFNIHATGSHTRIYRHDLNDQPGEEILVIASEFRQSRRAKTRFERLHFLSFSSKGHLLHDHIYNQEDIMGSEMDTWAYEKAMTMIASSAVFLDEFGKGIVAVGISNSTFTPAALIKADVNKGKFEVFFHKGFFPEMTARDFDGDGKREILLAGFNIPLDASIAAVIDPAHMTGSSPSGYNYNVPNMSSDVAKYYIKFPEFRQFVRYPRLMYPLGVSILDSENTLRLSIKSRAEDVVYSFTGDMRISDAEVVMSHTIEGGKKPDSLSKVYYDTKKQDEEELMRGVRYWDGTKWVKEPVMNRSYITYSGMSADSTIVRVDQKNTKLVMKNKLGFVIATHDVGFIPPERGLYRRTFFGDFLDEEGDEIACAFFNSRQLDETDPERNRLFILVFDEKGQLLRDCTYHERSILGAEMERVARKTNMQMRTASSPFSAEFERGYLFIGTHHRVEPPASLIKFSLDNGKYETFFHKGYFAGIIPRDVDGDGKNELLMTGYNVLLDSPVIIILDPDQVDGSSPRGACYSIPGKDRDIAKYYIRLPRYNRFERFNFSSYPLRVNILENTDNLRVIVESREEEVIFSIAEDMVFTDADIVKKDFKTRIISPATYPGIEKDEEELLLGVRFWDGENWVAKPTVNRSYLKHVREGD